MVMKSTLQPLGLQQGNLSLKAFNIVVTRADVLTFEHVDDT